MPYIISTMSSGVNYATYKKSPGGMMIADKEIAIKGGANVTDKVLRTVDGVITKVTNEELELLNNHPLFKKHKEAGFIRIQNSSTLNTSDMAKKDSGAQLVKSDFKKKGRKAPKVNKPDGSSE